jgi:hypothetical protein
MGAGGVWNRAHKYVSVRVQHFHLRGITPLPRLPCLVSMNN